MALIRLGSLVSEIRGSVAGTTFARNRSGAYARSRIAPLQPRTARQTAVRAAITSLQAYYGTTLDDAERNTWEELAAQATKTNRLGETIKLTPINLFIRANALKQLAGESVIESAPALPLAADAPTLTITGDTTDGLVIAAPDPVLVAGDVLQVLVSPALTNARNFWKGPWTTTLLAGSATVFPYTLIANTLLTIGERYRWQARFVSAAGRTSNIVTGTVDIAA